MQIILPIVPILLRIAVALPGIIEEVAADVKADRTPESDGGSKLTVAEIGVICGHVSAKIGAAIVPVVAKANSVPLA